MRKVLFKCSAIPYYIQNSHFPECSEGCHASPNNSTFVSGTKDTISRNRMDWAIRYIQYLKFLGLGSIFPGELQEAGTSCAP